ncbi:MAG: D-alanine--D-alanine ligase [Deltaproteobacteria bacterium]|jgi:D-alanine-D-alanine ligase|nr:D-alanine--D-alanine ligase [Deltaproteobacteria bacterium]
MHVLLLAGGWSSEREVSLRGAAQIEAALVARNHAVTRLDPARDFDRLHQTAKLHDVAFINLHGAPGEDGLIQAILDQAGCPYQGSGPAGSFLALHKAAAKQLFREAGLLTADWIYLPVRPGPDWAPDLPYPLFVKSNTGGSSLHLFRVLHAGELPAALDALFGAGEEVLIESAISGREVTCAVLGEQVLPPVLILPKAEFFDYHNKYAADGAQEICPAPLPETVTQAVQDAALAAHRVLGLAGCSRSDFILRDDGQLFLLESNTLPGMTGASLVPQEAAAVGLSFADLIERLLELALAQRGKPSTPFASSCLIRP